MSYYDKYQKYKNKYNKLKIIQTNLFGGLKEFTLYDVFYNDELKDLKIGFALTFKKRLIEIIKKLSMLLDTCGKDNVLRNFTISNIILDLSKSDINFYLNKNTICENSDIMRTYIKDELRKRLDKYDNYIKYILLCKKITNLNSDKIVETLFFMPKDKKNLEIENELDKIIKSRKITTIKQMIDFISELNIETKKYFSKILSRTDIRYLSPEALSSLYNIYGIINYDDEILRYRNSLLKSYESYYKTFEENYPLTMQEQLKKYNEITSILKTESDNLLKNLYSPIEDIGKFKDYIYKIEVYTFGMVLMELIKFIEQFAGPVENKYKEFVAKITDYDLLRRPDLNRIKKYISDL